MELFKYQEEEYLTINFMDHIDLSDDILDDYVPYNPKKRHQIFSESNTYHSQNQYIENYGNPLSTVRKDYFMIVVEKKEDKVSIKVFTGYRLRRRGNTWFKVSKNVEYLTFNLANGDYYYGSLVGYQKKKKYKKIFKKNCHYIKPLNLITHKIRTVLKNSRKLIISDHILESAIDSFVKEISTDQNNITNKDNVLIKSFLDRKSIKYPDNFEVFYKGFEFMIPYKFIKKNNFKIVDAFMDYNNIKGKNLKKALHLCENINVSLLNFSYNVFGRESINKDYLLIVKILNYETDFYYPSFYFEVDSNSFTKSELSKVLTLFRDYVLENKIDIYTFRDHINLYVKLKEYGEIGLRWKSSKQIEFREEHLDWSDKIEYYDRGKYYRIYPDYLSELITTKIGVNDVIYYPVLLNVSDEYNRESLIQSNCVKTYIGRPESIIISVRKGTEESEERATVEYFVQKDTLTKDIICKRKQSLGKFNQSLSTEWEQVLSKLDERLSLFVNEPLFDTVKIKKICSNGHEMYSDSHWDEFGQLRWSYKSIQ